METDRHYLGGEIPPGFKRDVSGETTIRLPKKRHRGKNAASRRVEARKKT